MIDANEIDLVQTCCACPEQYDAFYQGVQVGYLRLRFGYFRVDFPDHGGETIYSADTDGDGCFSSEESARYLNEAARAIAEKLNTQCLEIFT